MNTSGGLRHGNCRMWFDMAGEERMWGVGEEGLATGFASEG